MRVNDSITGIVVALVLAVIMVSGVAAVYYSGLSHQVPVLEDGWPIGLLTERKILEMTKPYHKLLVEEAMEEPVLVPKEANYHNIIPIMRQFQAVLVVDRGKMVGIITSTDLIGHKKKT
jgi:predicted transcriptional regulator